MGMSDEPDSIILRNLRGIREVLDRLAHDVSDIKVRMTNMEIGLSGVNRRLDRVDERLERLERRAGLIEADEA